MSREDEIAARLAAARENQRDSLIAFAPEDVAYLLARVRELEQVISGKPATYEWIRGEVLATWLASPEAQEQMAAALDTAKALRPHGWASNHLLAAAILAALREQP